MPPTDPVEFSSRIGGISFWGIVALICIGSNISAMRNRETSWKCALSIILSLAASITFALIGIIGGGSFALNILVGLLALLAIVILLVAIVFAIIGLVEFRARDYRKGFKRGVTSLVLCSLFGVAVIFGFVRAARNGGVLAGLAKGSAGQPVEVKEWNYRLDPPRPWVPVDAKRMNPAASAGFTRADPLSICLVLTEHTSGLVEFDKISEFLKARMAGTGEAHTITEGAMREGSMDGWQIETQVRMSFQTFFYVHWLTQHNGSLYQIVVWGPDNAREVVRANARDMRRSFHIIDPAKTALPTSALAEQRVTSPVWGYTVNLHGTGWSRAWPTLAQDNFSADWGIQNANGTAAFIIVPVWIGDGEVNLDALTQALLTRIGLPYPDDSIFGIKDWTQGQLRGRALACEKAQEGTEYLYRMRVLHGQGFAYLLAAWQDKRSDSLTDKLDEALDCVRFAPELKAPNPEVFDKNRKFTQALVCNDIGLALDRNGNVADALPWFRRGVEFSGKDAAIVGNYVEGCLKVGKPADAIAFLDEHLRDFPGNQKLAVKRAHAQLLNGNAEDGLKNYAAIFDGGWRDDVHFESYINALCENDRADEALAAVDRYAEGRNGNAFKRMKITVLQYQRKFPEAIDALREMQKNAPNDADIAVMLADSFFGAERYTDTIAECNKLIETGRDSTYVQRRKGFAEFALKQYREAKISLEKALEKSPADADLRRMVDHLSGMLGEGTNSAVKTAIEPVAIPASLMESGPSPKGSYLEGFSAWYLHSIKAIAFEKDHGAITTERCAIAIRDQQGVERFSTLEFRFDPLSEEIFVNALTVKDDKGKVLGTGNVETSYVMDEGGDEMATQMKVLHVPVPALKAGTTLEYTVTKRERAESDQIDFRSHFFARPLPVLSSVLYVKASRGSVKWETTGGVPEPKRNGDELTWTLRQPPVYRYEPLQPSIDTFMPMVWLSDAKSTWNGEAKKYLDQIKDRLSLDASLKQEVEDLVRDLKTDEQKTAAIARFVQRTLTYKAIEFGRRARIPAAASQTLRNKYGDCKDHALLLTQLLDAAGIQARLALVNFGSELHPGLPSLDQFNHMIAYLPKAGGATFIDCTSKVHDLRTTPPAWLADVRALILDPANPRIETIPGYPAGSTTIESAREITFPNETDAEVFESITFTGECADLIRGPLLAIEPADRTRQILQTMHSELSTLDLRHASVENVDNPQKPLTLQLRYVVRQRLRTHGSEMLAELPAAWERVFFAAQPEEKRQTPFRLRLPVRFSSRVAVDPPSGWQAKVPGKRETQSRFIDAATAARTERRKLILTTSLTQHPGTFPASDYRAYVEAMNAAVASAEPELVLHKAGE